MNRLDRIEYVLNAAIPFEERALSVFRYQYENVPIYQKFCQLRGIYQHDQIQALAEIPYLPIDFFRFHAIHSEEKVERIFRSSGTTSAENSSHHVCSEVLYQKSLRIGFERFFGDIKQYYFYALLPSYLERPDSSLVYMVQQWMHDSGMENRPFYKEIDLASLVEHQKRANEQGKKFFLVGVSFALWELAEKEIWDSSDALILESGGMKGRRKEITRMELHEILRKGLNSQKIYSEYGMTELLSQAYSMGDEWFHCSDSMRLSIRDIYDPSCQLPRGQSGLIQVADLSNVFSCSFIATADIGLQNDSGAFQVLGRQDHSLQRGCSQLWQ